MRCLSFVFAGLLVLLLTGCSPSVPPDGDSGSPLSTAVVPETGQFETTGGIKNADGLFYPLAIGNTWTFSRTFLLDGKVMATAHIESELTGYEQLFEREYMVEELRYTETAFGETDEFTHWIRLRQDRAGLYAADVAATQPPGASGQPASTGRGGPGVVRSAGLSRIDFLLAKIPVARKSPAWKEALRKNLEKHEWIRNAVRGFAASPPGGPTTDEITRLRYPLHPGQTWTIRDEPFFGSTVEAREQLDLPAGRRPAWRIRIDSELFDPEDEVYFWYGRCGNFGLYTRLTGVATDPEGNEIGTFVTEEIEVLAGLDLPSRPACGR